MHVCYAAVFRPSMFIDKLQKAVANIEARSLRRDAIYYHVLTERVALSTSKVQLCQPPWRKRLAPGRLRLHSVADVTPGVRELKAKLSDRASGPGRAYLWKLFIHHVLPSVKRVVLLDADVLLISDLELLWGQFTHFAQSAIMGVAREQNILYRSEVTARGGVGMNTGVVLMDLERMRRSRLYRSLVEGFANRSVPADHLMPVNKMKTFRLGYVADQTLLTFMTQPALAPNGASLFHVCARMHMYVYMHATSASCMSSRADVCVCTCRSSRADVCVCTCTCMHTCRCSRADGTGSSTSTCGTSPPFDKLGPARSRAI